MAKLITIITTVKNDKKNIVRTIKSLKKQTFKNFEYIILDGNSDDGTSEIIKKNIKHNNYKYFNSSDRNMYEGLNKAIRYSSGKYIGLLHSGDLFYNAFHLSKINKVLKNNPDLISGNILFFKKKKSNIIRNWRYPIKNLNLLNIPKIPHSSIFIKKKIAKKIMLYNSSYSISSDFDFMINLLKIKKIKYIYCDFVFTYMRWGGLSTIKSSLIKKSLEDLSILIKHFGIIGIIFYFYKIVIKIPSFSLFKKS